MILHFSNDLKYFSDFKTNKVMYSNAMSPNNYNSILVPAQPDSDSCVSFSNHTSSPSTRHYCFYRGESKPPT